MLVASALISCVLAADKQNGSDIDFTKEEQQLFDQMGWSNPDFPQMKIGFRRYFDFFFVSKQTRKGVMSILHQKIKNPDETLTVKSYYFKAESEMNTSEGNFKLNDATEKTKAEIKIGLKHMWMLTSPNVQDNTKLPHVEHFELAYHLTKRSYGTTKKEHKEVCKKLKSENQSLLTNLTCDLYKLKTNCSLQFTRRKSCEDNFINFSSLITSCLVNNKYCEKSYNAKHTRTRTRKRNKTVDLQRPVSQHPQIRRVRSAPQRSLRIDNRLDMLRDPIQSHIMQSGLTE